MKAIHNLLYLIICFVTLLIGCAEDPKMPDNYIGAAKPDLLFVEDSLDYSAIKATVYGKILSENGAEITEKGFVWWLKDEGKRDSSWAILEAKDDFFYMDIENLKDSSEYYVMAYAKNYIGTNYSDSVYFQTISGLAKVKTIEGPVLIRANRAVIKGEILSYGEGAIIEKGIAYRKATDQVYKDSIPADSEDGKFFEAEISGLIKETEYYVKAYVKNNFGSNNGAEVKIKTTDGRPVIKDFQQIGLTDTDVTFSANVTDIGDASVSSRGFIIYSNTKEALNGHDSLMVSVGGGSGVFGKTLTDLKPHYLYYVRAFAENEYGMTRTDSLTFSLISNAPTVITKSLNIAESGSIRVLGEILDWGENASSHKKGIVYSTVQGPTLERGTVVEDDSNVTINVKATKLKANTTYFVRTFATNSTGYTSYGNEMEITTPDMFQVEASYEGSAFEAGSAMYVSVNKKSSSNENERRLGYLYGGNTSTTVSDEFWEFNPLRQSWIPLKAAPYKRSRASAVYTSSAFLIFGGIGEDNLAHNTLFHYGGNTWSEKTDQDNDPPSPRYSTSAGLRDSMFIIGGIADNNGTNIILNEVWSYGLFSAKWVVQPNFPEAQYNSLVFSIGGILYAGLGSTSLGVPTSYSNRLFYIGEDNNWTELPSMPGGKALGGTVVGTDIYVIDEQGYIHVFSIIEKQWRTASGRVPVQNRKIHCVYSFNDISKIYIGLGENSSELISYDFGWDN